jgi:hypothetical protein
MPLPYNSSVKYYNCQLQSLSKHLVQEVPRILNSAPTEAGQKLYCKC